MATKNEKTAKKVISHGADDREAKADAEAKEAEEAAAEVEVEAALPDGVEVVATDPEVDVEELPGGGTRETPRKSRRYS